MSQTPAIERWLKPENVLLAAVLLLLAWMPFTHGANQTWSELVLATGFGVLLLAWSGLVMSGLVSQTPHIRALKWPAVCTGAALGWAGFQSVELVMLERATGLDLSALAHPVWKMAGTALEASSRAHISIAPDLTKDALLSAVVPVLAFLLAFNLCRDRQRAEAALVALVVIAAAYACIAVAEQLSGMDLQSLILSEARWQSGVLNGPFVNPDHFAAFLVPATLVAVGSFAERLRLAGAWERGVFAALWALTRFLAGRNGLLLLAVFGLFSAVILTQSGLAIASLAAGLVMLALTFSSVPCVNEAEARGQRAAVALVFAVLCIAVVAGGSSLQERFGSVELSPDGRRSVEYSTFDAMMAAPLQGQGFGTLEAYSPLYAEVPTARIVQAANNEPLEVLADLGAVAGLAFLATPLLLTLLCLNGALTRKRDRVYSTIALAAMMAAAVQAIAGFSLQIPAVSVTLAFLLGIGVTQSWRTNMDMVR
jgi:hypothetical protein